MKASQNLNPGQKLTGKLQNRYIVSVFLFPSYSRDDAYD